MKPYRPISCTFHDLIEHYATLSVIIPIVFQTENNEIMQLHAKITTWTNNGDGEYLIIDNYPKPIRLDHIISIDGKMLQSYC